LTLVAGVVTLVTCSSVQTVPARPAIWTDPATGLKWQAQGSGRMTWQQGKDYCANLDLGGAGWRLPNISELRSLIRGCPQTQPGGTCNVSVRGCLELICRTDECGGCQHMGGPAETCYWPGTMQGECDHYWADSLVGDNDDAWSVYFHSGHVGNGFRNVRSHIRCVR
jgi:hypothetical protein